MTSRTRSQSLARALAAAALCAAVVAMPVGAHAAGSCSGTYIKDGACSFVFTGFPITVTANYTAVTARAVGIHAVAYLQIGPTLQDAGWQCDGAGTKTTSCSATYRYGDADPPAPIPASANLMVRCEAHNLGPVVATDKGTFRCTSGTQL
jgi:hypothetical protein